MPKRELQRRIDAVAAAATSTVIVRNGGGGSPGGATYSAGDGINIDSANVISVDVPAIIDQTQGLRLVNNNIALRLQAASGLLVTAEGLAVADSLAGDGLAITDKVLAVGAGSGIAVSADAVLVKRATPASGLAFDAQGGLMLDDSVAGAGLAIADKILSVKPGLGLMLDSEAGNAVRVKLQPDPGLRLDSTGLAAGDPGTLDWLTTNSRVGLVHYHAIDTADDVGTTPQAKILRSNEQGGLTLNSLNVTGAAHVGESFFVGKETIRILYNAPELISDPDGIPDSGDELWTPAHSHLIVNPTGSWAFDEQFGVDIDDNLLVRGWIVGKHAIQLSGARMICHFDGPEPYLTDFSGSPAGHMGQAPTVYSGGVTFREGKFGKAVQLADSTTNLIPNPSFELDLGNWNDYVTGSATGTRERTSDDSKYGQYSLRLTRSSDGEPSDRWGVSRTFPITAGEQYTISFWTKTSGLGSARLVMQMYRNGMLAHAPITDVVDEWRRIERTFTANETGAANLSFYIDQGAGSCLIDAVQLEQKPYATPYCDGTLGGGELGDGHKWSGTAHASASTRPVGYLQYAYSDQTLTVDRGTVMGWVRHETAGGIDIVLQAGTGAVIELRRNSNKTIQARWGGSYIASSTLIPEHTWHHYAMTFDGTTLQLYIDGKLEATGAGTTDTAPARVLVGIGAGAVNSLNGLLDDLVILDRPLDADEIRAVYESNAPVFAETSSWHWRAGRNRFWADSEGMWMFSANNGPMFGAYAGSDSDPNAVKNWGGANLSEGDILIGNAALNNYLLWDASAGKLTVRGDLSVQGAVTEQYVNERRVLAVNAHFVPENDKFTWTQFTVRLGDGTSRTVNAGSHNRAHTAPVKYYHYISVVPTGGNIDLQWVRDTQLGSLSANHALIAVSDYRANGKPPSVTVLAGSTYISGDNIVTGSITTDHIDANGIDATKIRADNLEAVSSEMGNIKIAVRSPDGGLTVRGSIYTTGKQGANKTPGIYLGYTTDFDTPQFEVGSLINPTEQPAYISWDGYRFSIKSDNPITFDYRSTIDHPTGILAATVKRPSGMGSGTGNLRYGYESGWGWSFTMDAHLVPHANNMYTLGSTAKKWGDIYSAGTIWTDFRLLVNTGGHIQTNPQTYLVGQSGAGGTSASYTSIAPGSGFKNATIRYFRFANLVHVFGEVEREPNFNTVIATFPAEVRPKTRVFAPLYTNGAGGANSYCSLETNGQLIILGENFGGNSLMLAFNFTYLANP